MYDHVAALNHLFWPRVRIGSVLEQSAAVLRVAGAPQKADPRCGAAKYGPTLVSRVNAVSMGSLLLERRGVCSPRWRQSEQAE
jgi:hypothetical protein